MNTKKVANDFINKFPEFEGELKVAYNDEEGSQKATVYWVTDEHAQKAKYKITSGEGNGICENCGRIFLDHSVYFCISELGVAHVCNRCRLKLGLYRTTESESKTLFSFESAPMDLPFSRFGKNVPRATVQVFQDSILTTFTGELEDEN